MNRLRGTLLAVLLIGLATQAFRQYQQRDLPAEVKAQRLNDRRGSALAELASQVLPKGAKVLLVTYTTETEGPEAGMNPGCERALERAGFERLATEYLDAPGRNEAGLDVRGLSATLARQLVEQHPGVEALLSLCGDPRGEPANWKGLPPLVCLCQRGDRIPEFMKQRVVAAAWVPRRTGLQSGRSNDWFDALYQAARPETIGEIYGD